MVTVTLIEVSYTEKLMDRTAYSKPHIKHLSNPKRMLQRIPGREYALGDAPEGFKNYWSPFFDELNVVACLTARRGPQYGKLTCRLGK